MSANGKIMPKTNTAGLSTSNYFMLTYPRGRLPVNAGNPPGFRLSNIQKPGERVPVGRGQNRVRLSPCDNSPVLGHKSVIHENGKKGITIRVFPADQINLPDTQFEPPPLHLINISNPNGAYSGPNARISSVKSRIGFKNPNFHRFKTIVIGKSLSVPAKTILEQSKLTTQSTINFNARK